MREIGAAAMMGGGGASILGRVDTTAGGAASGWTSGLGGDVTVRSGDGTDACGAREVFADGATSWKPRSSTGALLRLAPNPKNCASVLSPARHSSSAANGRERRVVVDFGALGAGSVVAVADSFGDGFSAGADGGEAK